MSSAIADGRPAVAWTRPDLARGPVLAPMATLTAVLTATSVGYGYDRDELYFRMLKPGWGYFDEPPLTPLLAHGIASIIDTSWAIRIPATLASVASVYVVAQITREVGGGRGAQALCAWAYAFASIPLVMGHVLLTSTLDLPVWPLVLLFVIRAQLRSNPRWWLAAGVVVGLSLYNKLLVAILLAAVAAGFLAVGPRRALWSRYVLAAAALAVLIGSPNVIYQATHHWPELSMGRALRDHNAGDVRAGMWPFLLLMLGPPLVPIWVAGLVSVARRPQWRPIRFLAAAFPVLLALVFAMGAQEYYPFGLVATLFAIGCVPAVGWVRRALSWRRPLVAAAVALNASVALTIGLPIIPVTAVGGTPIPSINLVTADSVGWPSYVRQVAAAYAALPTADRDRAVILTSNYGEAGAVDRFGPRYRLPKVYSAQNQLYFQARPPDSATVAVMVGGEVPYARTLFASCVDTGRLDNGADVDNEEQGLPIAICSHPVDGWGYVWPKLRHAD